MKKIVLFLNKHTFKKSISNDKIKKILHGFLWNAFGALISKGSVFLISIFSARLLGLEDFGKLGMVQQTLGTFQLFAVMGLGVTATKFVSEYNSKEKKHHLGNMIRAIRYLSTASSFFCAFVLLSLSGVLSEYQLNDSQLKEKLWIISVAVFFSGLSQTQTGILSGLQKFNWIAKSGLIVAMITFPVMIFLVYKYAMNGAIAGIVFNSFLQLLANQYYISRAKIHEESTHQRLAFEDIKKIMSFGIPSFMAGLVIMPVTWYAFSLLTAKNEGYSELGALNAANQIFAIVYFIPIVLAQVIMPMISSGEKEGKQILKISLTIITLITVPILCSMIFFSDIIMRIYGEKVGDYSNVLIVVLLTSGVFCIQTQIDHYIVAKGKTWLHFQLNLLFGVIFIITSHLLLVYGALGIAFARLFGYTVRLIILIITIKVKGV